MNKQIAIVLSCLMLTGCAGRTVTEVTAPETTSATTPIAAETVHAPEYRSRFGSEMTIQLSDDSISTDAGEEAVFVSRDIVYYEDRDVFDSGNPYGEGSETEKHTVEEASAHTVVNITQPGAYRVSGKLSAGQIRIDLGNTAYYDPEAVVELILDNADITCTVAPAILFQNVYECDGEWSADTAKAEVDTSDAGANLILEGTNCVSGSHVAKIYQDGEGEKKLWKQDGAVYSYMSMNVFGPGSLELTADNEGLNSELHLTINGGTIHIDSDNDGINTNEDGVSVTTINGGNLTIRAGLREEGDGIDSNGYLVINGGRVVAFANPAADAGLDSDLGSYIHGGTVIAMGAAMDWAESDSQQTAMNLQFTRQQSAGAKILRTRVDGTQIFSFESDDEYARPFGGLILSHPFMSVGETYHVYIDGVQMAYTGTDMAQGRPGMGQMGQIPEGMAFPEGPIPQMPQLPEGESMPAEFDPSQIGGREMNGQRPGGGQGDRTPPQQFQGEMPAMPEGGTPEMPRDGFGGPKNQNAAQGESSTEFYMRDKVNAFTGIQEAQ